MKHRPRVLLFASLILSAFRPAIGHADPTVNFCAKHPAVCAKFATPGERPAFESLVIFLTYEFTESRLDGDFLEKVDDDLLLKVLTPLVHVAERGEVELRTQEVARWFVETTEVLALRSVGGAEFRTRFRTFSESLSALEPAALESLGAMITEGAGRGYDHVRSFSVMLKEVAATDASRLPDFIRGFSETKGYWEDLYLLSLYEDELIAFARGNLSYSPAEIYRHWRARFRASGIIESRGRVPFWSVEKLYSHRFVPRDSRPQNGSSAVYVGQEKDVGKNALIRFKPKIGRTIEVEGKIESIDRLEFRVTDATGFVHRFHSHDGEFEYVFVRESGDFPSSLEEYRARLIAFLEQIGRKDHPFCISLMKPAN